MPGLFSLQYYLTHVPVFGKAPEINLSASSKWKIYDILTWKKYFESSKSKILQDERKIISVVSVV